MLCCFASISSEQYYTSTSIVVLTTACARACVAHVVIFMFATTTQWKNDENSIFDWKFSVKINAQSFVIMLLFLYHIAYTVKYFKQITFLQYTSGIYEQNKAENIILNAFVFCHTMDWDNCFEMNFHKNEDLAHCVHILQQGPLLQTWVIFNLSIDK